MKRFSVLVLVLVACAHASPADSIRAGATVASEFVSKVTPTFIAWAGQHEMDISVKAKVAGTKDKGYADIVSFHDKASKVLQGLHALEHLAELGGQLAVMVDAGQRGSADVTSYLGALFDMTKSVGLLLTDLGFTSTIGGG